MYALEPIIFFVFGTALGSFLNVVIGRYAAGVGNKEFGIGNYFKSIGAGRSHCPKCHKTLRWWELVPILSFIFLKGRCARCQKQISIQYPLVELAFGLITLILGLRGDYLAIIIAALLIVLFVIDLKTFYLPDIYVGLLTVVVVVSLVVSCQTSVVSCSALAALGAAVGSGFLGFLWLVTRGKGIGLGDVKLMVPLGLLFGLWGTVVLVFAAFVVGGAYGVVLLAAKKADMKTAVPFGPFLAGSALLLLLLPQATNYIINTFFSL